jgi:two-component system response regulator MprA
MADLTPARLLVVDDDPLLRTTVGRALRLEGYDVVAAEDGVVAWQHLRNDVFGAVVLDVSMPRLDGLTVCRRMREAGDRTPVLMLTARDGIPDRVGGLDAGADDYLVKPFALEELHARVRALLRRATDDDEREVLRYADLELDLTSLRGRRGERVLELTKTEQRLLEVLLRNPDRVLPRDVLYERVWGHDISMSSNALDVYVGYLRRKLEQGASRGWCRRCAASASCWRGGDGHAARPSRGPVVPASPDPAEHGRRRAGHRGGGRGDLRDRPRAAARSVDSSLRSFAGDVVTERAPIQGDVEPRPQRRPPAGEARVALHRPPRRTTSRS